MVKFSKPATKAAIAGSKGNNKGAFIPQVLGATKELRHHIYLIGRNQAEKYIRTTEKVSEYAGLHISKEMRIVVLHGDNDTLKPPKQLGKKEAETPGRMEEYKVELSAYQRKKDKFDDDLATLFEVIYGQCTERVKLKLKVDSEFPSLRADYDVSGLLKKLRVMAFSTNAIQHVCLTAHDAARRFLNIGQGPKESIEHYLIRFMAIAEVKDEQFGQLYPDKLVSGTRSKDETSEQYNTMVFLYGADRHRYGKLLTKYSNDYLAKSDKYPKTLDEAVTLLSNYRSGYVDKKPDVETDDVKVLEASFAQMAKKGVFKKKGVKVVCYRCNQEGHISPNCPMKDQASDGDSVKSSSSHGSSAEHWSGYQG